MIWPSATQRDREINAAILQPREDRLNSIDRILDTLIFLLANKRRRILERNIARAQERAWNLTLQSRELIDHSRRLLGG